MMVNVVAEQVAIHFLHPEKGLNKDFTLWPSYTTLPQAVSDSINKSIKRELQRIWVPNHIFLSVDEQRRSEAAMFVEVRNAFKAFYMSRVNNAERKDRPPKLPFGTNGGELVALQEKMKMVVDQSSSGFLYYSAYIHIFIHIHIYKLTNSFCR